MVAEPSCGVARHGGNATVPVCADSAMHARTDSQNTEGGAVWAEHLRWAALESGSFFSGPSRASTDLARRARVPAGSSTPLPFDAGQDFSPSGNGTVRPLCERYVRGVARGSRADPRRWPSRS